MNQFLNVRKWTQVIVKVTNLEELLINVGCDRGIKKENPV